MASHQMYQIKAKPHRKARAPMIKPWAVFFGISVLDIGLEVTMSTRKYWRVIGYDSTIEYYLTA